MRSTKALVHYQEPWIEYSVLRSAHKRWKATGQPENMKWPEQQVPRTAGFVVPPPPVPAPYLLHLMGLVQLDGMNFVVKAGHSSLPLAPRVVHPDPGRQHRSAPSLMPTTHFGSGMTYASTTQTQLYFPYYTGQSQQQQHNHMQTSNSSFASQPTVEAPLPALPQRDPSPLSAETAQDDSMDDADYESEEEYTCHFCTGECTCPAMYR
ncbi:hypothetical protein L207DRAFT_574978 [Hyaloscypha variabilis F]|uniref:Uncharacterized protein n=1 Tax=Hyaloscypha variabilis (strain UAMH 11265 / GT02V1 / F) TaxID=1149755 RepID=A0A2J6SC14_HYAVF|nr:hypothetical protein L207DRAFT_574978 [Hyaloscypha variabilis F]